MTRRAWRAFTRTQCYRELLDSAWVIGLLVAAWLCFAVSLTGGVAR